MLVSIQPVPFADAGRQRQYEALAAALQAEAGAPATVLVGNMAAFTPVETDALIVRPASLTLVRLLPHAGQLTVAAQPGQPWLLDGQPLPIEHGTANPLGHYQQQSPLALAWLSEQLGILPAELPPCAGLVLFEAPLTFGAGVEAYLHRQAADHDFQLVGGAGALTPRLPLPHPAAPTLAEEELLDWATYLAEEPYVAHQQGRTESAADYLTAKLQELWRWLGAEDIPADPPYGGYPPAPDLAQRDQQEQARLHQLRQELQAELAQHRHEAAAREATRTQELAQLRQQLAQASQPPATQQAQADLETAMRAARAELATRSHELDTRIRQLEQLMQRQQAATTAAALASQRSLPVRPGGLTIRPGVPARAAGPVLRWSSYRPLRRAERWAVLALALALLGGGTWGVAQLAKSPLSPARLASRHRAAATLAGPEAQPAGPVIVYDTLPASASYAADAPGEDPPQAADAPAPEAQLLPVHSGQPPRVDSARLETTPAPLLPGDSAATEASPTP